MRRTKGGAGAKNPFEESSNEMKQSVTSGLGKEPKDVRETYKK